LFRVESEQSARGRDPGGEKDSWKEESISAFSALKSLLWPVETIEITNENRFSVII
jgi:hypothetical protein